MGPAPSGDRTQDLIVERFDRDRHDTSRFQCGQVELDTYIRETLERDEADHTAATYVLVYGTAPGPIRRVVGYFTINGYAFPKRQGRRRDRDRNLGTYNPAPAFLIGRLALDSDFHGQGIGSILLFAALHLTLSLREHIGAVAVVVHALDEAAARFYEYHGFTRFRDEPLHLYYPLSTFAQAVVQRS